MPEPMLHLPNLFIKSFRGIEELTIRELGRVTLIVGQNSVGKSTVLDAVRVFAERGRGLDSLLVLRDEYSVKTDDDEDSFREPNWDALFYGRETEPEQCLTIGPVRRDDRVTVRLLEMDGGDTEGQYLHTKSDRDPSSLALKIGFRGKERLIPLSRYMSCRTGFRRETDSRKRAGVSMPSVACEVLGPGLLDNNTMARYWDEIVLTDDENLAMEALALIFEERIERIAIVGRSSFVTRNACSRLMPMPVVRFRRSNRPVPLKSLGSAASRLFSVAMALSVSRDGFLLIDEAENGLYYELQEDFWRMVLRSAHANNVQVLATTHSWDCVQGFASATEDLIHIEGRLVRLDRDADGRMTVSEYSEGMLAAAARHNIEVR